MSTTEIFNLIASIFGIITGVLAIILSLIFFFSSKRAERNSESAMIGIKDATTSLTTLSMRMLNKVTGALIAPRPSDEKLTDILREISGGGKLMNNDGEGTIFTEVQLEQFRVGNLISTYYYCTLTNLAYKTMLPQSIEEVASCQSIANMVNQTKLDCTTLKDWLKVTANIGQKIESSPVKHLYEELMTLQSSVQSVEEFYIYK